MPQIHPDPIPSPSAVKNALFDSDLCFPIFHFQKFHFFPPPFASFRVFRGPKCIGTAPTNLTTDFTDPIWIKDRRPMLQIHPDPILSPSVVKNALVDPDLHFSRFYFPQFHLFRPCLVRFLRLLCLLWLVRSSLLSLSLILNSKLKLARRAAPLRD